MIIKKMPTWEYPNYKGHWSYARKVDMGFVIAFSYKMQDCNESAFKIHTTPADGIFSEYYRINNRKKVDGFFKNGNADSLWVFYDTTGLVICKGYYKKCLNVKNGKKKHFTGRINGDINGTKHGIWEYYDSSGQLMVRKQFDCDKIVSEFSPSKHK